MDFIYSDTDLILLSRSGDQFAEEVLAKRYSKTVRICARRFFLVGGDGEDLIQEGMLGLLSAIRNFDLNGSASFKTYAEKCIQNRLISVVDSADRMKHSPLNHGVSLDLLDIDVAQRTSDWTSERQVEDVIIKRERLESIRSNCQEKLSRFETKVLALYLDGMTYKEISMQLERTEKSVDNAVQRIRKKFCGL